MTQHTLVINIKN